MRRGRVRHRVLGLILALHLAVLLAVVYGYGGFTVHDERPVSAQAPAGTGQYSLPARTLREAFERHCAGCHGLDGGGGPKGPPLVHVIYRSAHHADVAFTLAVRRGVAAHHWRFGDMPPQPAVTPAELDDIVRYVRRLQQARGIE